CVCVCVGGPKDKYKIKKEKEKGDKEIKMGEPVLQWARLVVVVGGMCVDGVGGSLFDEGGEEADEEQKRRKKNKNSKKINNAQMMSGGPFSEIDYFFICWELKTPVISLPRVDQRPPTADGVLVFLWYGGPGGTRRGPFPA